MSLATDIRAGTERNCLSCPEAVYGKGGASYVRRRPTCLFGRDDIIEDVADAALRHVHGGTVRVGREALPRPGRWPGGATSSRTIARCKAFSRGPFLSAHREDLRLCLGVAVAPLPVADRLDELVVQRLEPLVPGDEAPLLAQRLVEFRIEPMDRRRAVGSMRYFPSAFITQPLSTAAASSSAATFGGTPAAAAISPAVAILMKCEPFTTRNVSSSTSMGWASKGEIATAYVVLRPGATPDEEAILALCRAELAAYKVPKAIKTRLIFPKHRQGRLCGGC